MIGHKSDLPLLLTTKAPVIFVWQSTSSLSNREKNLILQKKKIKKKKNLSLQERVNEIDVEESYVWGLEEWHLLQENVGKLKVFISIGF